MSPRAELFLIGLLLTAGCGSGDYAAGPVPPPPPPLPVTVTVGPDDAAIAAGQTLKYQAVSTSTVASWLWSVSDPAKGSISSDGLFLAVVPGAVQIRACASNAPSICGAAGATVLGPPGDPGSAAISVTPAADTISVTQSVQFTATATGFVTPGWTWSAIDYAVATIDGNGLLTARRPGAVVVVACATNQPHYCGSAEVHVR
jgi:hypothetical protein